MNKIKMKTMFERKNKIQFAFTIAFLFLVFFSGKSLGQECNSCSVTITDLDSLEYTVNPGNVLCVSENSECVGRITLNGGTICIKGSFKPKHFTIISGSILNQGSFTIDGSIVLNENTVLNNNTGGVVNINGTLSLNSGVLSNYSICNVLFNIDNAGTINNTNVINCTELIGSGTFNNTGIISFN